MKPIHKAILITAIFTLIACATIDSKDVYQIEEDVQVETQREYEEVLDYQLLLETTFDVKSENYYVYFYSLSCTHCNEIKNYIIEKALERKDIYFIKGTSKDKITTDTKKLIGAENPEDIWLLGYPSLLLISNKKCTKNLAGEQQIKNELK